MYRRLFFLINNASYKQVSIARIFDMSHFDFSMLTLLIKFHINLFFKYIFEHC